jgi:hypothetical protein
MRDGPAGADERRAVPFSAASRKETAYRVTGV